MRLIRA